MIVFLWQANVGREKDFQVALRNLRGKDADVSHEAAEIEVSPFTETSLVSWVWFFVVTEVNMSKLAGL